RSAAGRTGAGSRRTSTPAGPGVGSALGGSQPFTLPPTADSRLGKSGTGSEPGHRVAQVAVDPHHQVQVAAGRVTGGADVADHLALAHPIADPDRVADGVVVGRGDIAAVDLAVVDDQPVAVAGVVVLLLHPALVRGPDRSAAPGAEVGAVVQLPVVQHRVEP